MTSSLSSFVQYKNVNISKTKKDFAKRQSPFFFTLKSVANKQHFFLLHRKEVEIKVLALQSKDALLFPPRKHQDWYQEQHLPAEEELVLHLLFMRIYPSYKDKLHEVSFVRKMPVSATQGQNNQRFVLHYVKKLD